MNETPITYHEWNPHNIPWMKHSVYIINETLIIYYEWKPHHIPWMKPASYTMNKTLIVYREWNPHHIPWLKPSPHTMPPNDVVVASCDVNEAAAAEVAWSRGGPGSRAPGVFESRRCYFVGEDEKQNRHVGEWDLESRGLVLKNTWMIKKTKEPLQAGSKTGGILIKTKGPLQAGTRQWRYK